ncbi:MAG: peptide chain release factor 1 [Candidatus Dependentiae bacterium]|nr:peptide chain release factor 1 [Candidatus Dependentiae bacterium]
MVNHWDAIEKRHALLVNTVMDTTLDRNKRSALQKELSQLTIILDKKKEVDAANKAIADMHVQMSTESDSELKELFELELEDFVLKRDLANKRLDELMIAPDEHGDRSVFLEIRAGTGGQEAALFAGNLMTMYTNYALKHHWKVTTESESFTDLGGYREVVIHIKGNGVFSHLKYESGVHRVQRVPATETSGRVHTSTATVAVLPEAEEVDVDIKPSDLRIDVYRASGAGGQHVNTTDSAVRITHIPTGVVVTCQDERSQHKNKAKAMKVLQSRILAAQMEKEHLEMAKQRKDQVGTGQRAEKVRTYNFPQNRVTDHQVDLTLKKLDMVMAGDLDEIIDALRVQDYEMRKKIFLSQF